MNTANRFSALFGRTAGTIPSARLELGDASVEFTPVGSRPGAGLANGNTITYPGAYPGAALRYEVRSDALKESIVLTGSNAPATYTFALTLSNLTYIEEANGSITLARPGDSKPLLSIPRPFMFEEGDEATNSFDVTQTIRQEGTELYLDIQADAGWLQQPERKFPVIIDPTIEVRPDALASRDTFASSSQASTPHHTLTSLYAGKHATYGDTRS